MGRGTTHDAVVPRAPRMPHAPGRASIPALQDRHERFLRDVDAADALHALLAFFLFLEQLALARDVAAVALGGDVFADRLDRFASDHLSTDRCLERDLEQVAVDFFL